MILPDNYIEDYYNLNFQNLSKPPDNKYMNLNFGRLTTDRKLVQMNIEIQVKKNLRIRETFDWDLTEEKKNPELFAIKFCEELKEIIDPDLFYYNIRDIKNQILDQVKSYSNLISFNPYFF